MMAGRYFNPLRYGVALLVTLLLHGGLLLVEDEMNLPQQLQSEVVSLSLSMITLPQNHSAETLTPVAEAKINKPTAKPSVEVVKQSKTRETLIAEVIPAVVAEAVKTQPLVDVVHASSDAIPKAEPGHEAAATTQTVEELQATEEPHDMSSNNTTVASAAAQLPLILEPRFQRPPTPPKYPRQAKLRNQEGTVLLQALVDAHGQTEQVRIVQSSGYHLLDYAAEKAVSRWEFVPANHNGATAQAWVQVPVRFALK